MHRGLVMGKLSVCLSVRLFVRLSDKRVICDKTKESCAHIFLYHMKDIYSSFVTRGMVVACDDVPFSAFDCKYNYKISTQKCTKMHYFETKKNKNTPFPHLSSIGASILAPSALDPYLGI